jgi:voltage-gated potassium channel
MNKDHRTSTRVVLVLAALLIGGGTAGFATLKGQSLGNAFYQTLILLTAHVYHPIDESLTVRLLILILIIGGIILIAYLIKWFVEYIIEGELKGGFSRRRMEKRLLELTDHCIITGLGRVGRQVAEEIAPEGVPFVITERNPARAQEAKDQGWLVVEGDASDDKVLQKAGIARAKTLVVATGDDSDNVFIALGARALNPNLFIVARANSEQAMDKLKKAGADKVAMPHRIGGYHMATMALRPAVVDFLDVIVDNKHRELQVEEILIGPTSPLIGKPLSSYLSRKKTGTTVLAINRGTSAPIINPEGDDLISAGDRLIVMGTQEQLKAIAGMR